MSVVDRELGDVEVSPNQIHFQVRVEGPAVCRVCDRFSRSVEHPRQHLALLVLDLPDALALADVMLDTLAELTAVAVDPSRGVRARPLG
jgi:hypothetical protein